MELHDVEIPEELKLVDSYAVDDNHNDYILAKVQPGPWIIEHYYDIVGDREDGIFTKLYLKYE